MTDTLEGRRATLALDVVVVYDDGSDDIRVRRADERYGAGFSVSRQALSNIRAPIQRPDAKIWHASEERELTVVLHDPTGGQYVVRTESGVLIVIDDDGDIRLADDVREFEPEPPLEIPDAKAQADRILAAATPTPEEHGPNCECRFLDPCCGAAGCLAEIPF